MRQLDHVCLPVQKVIFGPGIEWGKSCPFKRTDPIFGRPHAEQRLSQSLSADTDNVAKVRLPAPAVELAVWTRSSYTWISCRMGNFVTSRKKHSSTPKLTNALSPSGRCRGTPRPRIPRGGGSSRRVAPSARAPPAAAGWPPHGAARPRRPVRAAGRRPAPARTAAGQAA